MYPVPWVRMLILTHTNWNPLRVAVSEADGHALVGDESAAAVGGAADTAQFVAQDLVDVGVEPGDVLVVAAGVAMADVDLGDVGGHRGDDAGLDGSVAP